jgi:hypothetical protein
MPYQKLPNGKYKSLKSGKIRTLSQIKAMHITTKKTPKPKGKKP